MSVEPSANSFRASVIRRADRPGEILKRVKEAKRGRDGDALGLVPIPRSECRRGNQRGGDRHRLTAEQAILVGDHGETVVEIVNLSAGGAMISTDVEFTLWDHVGLILGGEDAIDCTVRWLKGQRVGLEFAEETRIDCDHDVRDAVLRSVIKKSFPDLDGDPLYYPQRRADDEPGVTPEEAQRRTAERHTLIWNGVVHHDGDVEPVRLRNISTSGALVQSSHELSEGAVVSLDLGPAGQIDALVRWTRGGQSGLSFANDFDIRRLAEKTPSLAAGESTAKAGHTDWNRRVIDERAGQLGG